VVTVRITLVRQFKLSPEPEQNSGSTSPPRTSFNAQSNCQTTITSARAGQPSILAEHPSASQVGPGNHYTLHNTPELLISNHLPAALGDPNPSDFDRRRKGRIEGRRQTADGRRQTADGRRQTTASSRMPPPRTAPSTRSSAP